VWPVSIEASSFVLGLSMGRGNGLRKLILLGYANHADKDGRGAYPSTKTIADYAECDIRTVQRHLGWLITAGYLHEGDQQMVDHLDPRYRPIVYDVAMSAEQIDHGVAKNGRASGNRARAAEAGRRGGQTSAQVSRGDRLSPQPDAESPQISGGDRLSPLEGAVRGDSSGDSRVTHHAARGDTDVTQTIQEPSKEPSSSSPVAPTTPASAGGGSPSGTPDDPLEVLPKSVRDHPSIVPSALSRRVHVLDQGGWSRAEIRARLTGIETAEAPGAAAMTRLRDLVRLAPTTPPPQRPNWCGQCDRRTRMREDTGKDDRPYRCPHCHPQAAAASSVPSNSYAVRGQGDTGEASA
jgi:hypothetical protein